MREPVSLLNDVLGPVMRGPSSSHTAGSYHIARLAAQLLGARPASARVTFDPAGSYARVYRQQGVDLAFAAGLLGWELTDDRFLQALAVAATEGMSVTFEVAPLAEPDHPNTADLRLRAADGRTLALRARSVGGGAVEITRLNGWPVVLRGHTWEALAEVDAADAATVSGLMARDGQLAGPIAAERREGRVLLHARRLAPLAPGGATLAREAAAARAGAARGAGGAPDIVVREAAPIAFVKRGGALFADAADMLAMGDARGWSLGRLGLEYEAQLLGLPPDAILAETLRRFDLMRAAVHAGLSERAGGLQLLAPSAGAIFREDAAGRLPMGGLHTRAAARAMAVMHVNGSMGVVCAAPTGGSAGAVPAVVVTLVEEKGLDRETAARALLAASLVGLVLATRATFAAEVAGCQVEIGAAGAMAAAAVVDAAGGSARQAADAAAIAFQNTMGSVCDLVQGMVEIPCHTRNAVAASSAFVCADLVIGGYVNPIPLDETIDAVFAVGRMLPPELRCTARGGLAMTPSALALRRR